MEISFARQKQSDNLEYTNPYSLCKKWQYNAPINIEEKYINYGGGFKYLEAYEYY